MGAEMCIRDRDNNALESVSDVNNDTDTMKSDVLNDVKEELKEVIEKVISNNVNESSNQDIDDNSKSQSPIMNVDTKPLNTSKLTFNNTDSVLDMGTNKESNVDAPKTIERLEEISRINDAKRKAEEAEYDDDDEDSLKIMDDDNVDLGLLDIHDLNKPLSLDDTPILTDVEILQ